MRKESHTRSALIVSAALVVSLALPATVLLSREDDSSPEIAGREDLVASVNRGELAAVSVGSDPIIPWQEDAAQSASMVIVGSLLIGIGTIIRRSV
jgi:hypothetical protein